MSTMHIIVFYKVLAGTSTSCSHTPSCLETLYPGALKLVSGRMEETLSCPTSPPAGLITAWTQRTWAGMRQEYLSSGEERIVLPEISETGQCLLSSNTRHGSSCILNLCSRPAELRGRGGGVLPPGSGDFCQHHRPLPHDHWC